ncbi:hypothetical protein ACFE04_013543 [Oxalis oulophora]
METLYLTVNLFDRFLAVNPIAEEQTTASRRDGSHTRKEVIEMEKLMLELLSFFVIELSLIEYEMLKSPPSLLAAAAIYTAQCTLNGCMQWRKPCELHTNSSEDQLLECSRLMVRYHEKAGSGEADRCASQI